MHACQSPEARSSSRIRVGSDTEAKTGSVAHDVAEGCVSKEPDEPEVQRRAGAEPHRTLHVQVDIHAARAIRTGRRVGQVQCSTVRHDSTAHAAQTYRPADILPERRRAEIHDVAELERVE